MSPGQASSVTPLTSLPDSLGFCAISETRPRHLDCSFEAICEGCGFFETTIAFRPTLQAQHDDAVARDQQGRVEVFQKLLDSPAAHRNT